MLKRLKSFRDPSAAVRRSIENGWIGVFERPDHEAKADRVEIWDRMGR